MNTENNSANGELGAQVNKPATFKKQYSRPVFAALGTVKELTQGGTDSGGETLGASGIP